MEIIAYNHDIPLDTPIHLKATLRELLNLCASIDSISPSSVREYLMDAYDMTEEKATDVMIIEKDAEGKTEYSTHKLSVDIRGILKKYGFLNKYC